jgi:phospholipid/cholesterol/gamma-HCH transport system substrate-binding protein
MADSIAETVLGAAVLAAAVGFAIYAGQSTGFAVAPDRYELTARFRSAEGISVGTDVRLAGNKVGSVTALRLDPATYQAEARFTVERDLQLPEDSDVAVASEGLLGGVFLELTPGSSDFMLAEGDEIVNTQGPVSLLNLLMRFRAGQ